MNLKHTSTPIFSPNDDAGNHTPVSTKHQANPVNYIKKNHDLTAESENKEHKDNNKKENLFDAVKNKTRNAKKRLGNIKLLGKSEKKQSNYNAFSNPIYGMVLDDSNIIHSKHQIREILDEDDHYARIGDVSDSPNSSAPDEDDHYARIGDVSDSPNSSAPDEDESAYKTMYMAMKSVNNNMEALRESVYEDMSEALKEPVYENIGDVNRSGLEEPVYENIGDVNRSGLEEVVYDTIKPNKHGVHIAPDNKPKEQPEHSYTQQIIQERSKKNQGQIEL
ncbi:hypothetical protein CAXC1_180019 [Candidatus Xenohaliotis californiensis]|uniref:Uncharacterized protein n=1 Tax=Candidatus Xenohaliotis californiensis TaxID=84677 RepID=A0ABP0ERZ4_9RICK|nr:hypothetical protein CAXC1_180019 [Candidatus Xenohaliotis californiensis]